MHCVHCRATNDPADERCTRCGRRLHFAAPRPAPEGYGAATAVAPALEALPGGLPLTERPPEKPEPQTSLFREPLNDRKVIPIPTLTPARVRERLRVQHVPKPASVRSPQHRARRTPDPQQTLELREVISEPLVHPGETIYCDAPVALPVHRLLAASVDGALVLAGVGVFLIFLFLLGGDISLDRHGLPFLAGITAIVMLFYRTVWCLADGDSPGMRFAGLKLIDFDGRRPDRQVRMIRQVASLLGFLSIGLGLVWAFVDEENLTWHDHISKTFPTSVQQ